MIATGQLILGTDKRNALFTVYEWEQDDGEEQLHVYGLELLEVVPADRNALSFKMLVGRLYNAGLSRRVLQETFRVDLKTIQRWAAALRSRDGEELVRARNEFFQAPGPNARAARKALQPHHEPH